MELRKIDLGNVYDIIQLKVGDAQRSFVATNTDSLVDAYATVQSGYAAHPFGLYEEDALVGFAMLGYDTTDDPDEPAIAKGNYCLWRFMIDEKHQGKGLGKKAMEAVLSHVRTFPYGPAAYCWLSYEPENTVARALYAKYGFVENGELCGDEIVACLRL